MTLEVCAKFDGEQYCSTKAVIVMPKSRVLEQLLAQFEQVRLAPITPEAAIVLHHILNSKYAIAIAQAATWIGETGQSELIPDLVAAFERCMTKPSETDPGCTAKLNLAEALYQLDYRDESLFLRGIRYVQRDPVWGGTDDTAAALRGVCALALVRLNYPQVLEELADLLADPKADARMAAARAIAYSENPSGVALLRLRIKLGDTAPVLSECFLALLKLSPDASISLVRSFLQIPPIREERDVIEAAMRALSRSKPQEAFEILRQWIKQVDATEVAEGAALALGESRIPAAFPILREWWTSIRSSTLRQTALMSITMLRQDDAISFLLTLIGEGSVPDAKAAILALGIYQQDQALWNRVCQAVQHRDEPSLLTAIRDLKRSAST